MDCDATGRGYRPNARFGMIARRCSGLGSIRVVASEAPVDPRACWQSRLTPINREQPPETIHTQGGPGFESRAQLCRERFRQPVPGKVFYARVTVLCTGCDPGVPVPPLCMAARAGDAAKIADLVKAGADVNERGGVNDWTPLMHAVHKNQPRAVRALIDAGADVNATAGPRGRDTALRLAEIQGLPDIAAMLRAHGAASPPALRYKKIHGYKRTILSDLKDFRALRVSTIRLA